MEIKICGLTKEREAEYLNEAEADYAGFVFYEKSKRFVEFNKARKIMNTLSKDVKRVAVVVSPDVEMLERLSELPIDILQVHGKLSEDIINSAQIPIWRAINLEDNQDDRETIKELTESFREKENKLEGILFDAPVFGSGKTFEWDEKAGAVDNIFSEALKNKKLILAGGLNSLNVGRGIGIFKPNIVDVSSGVEGDAGKDRKKILEFVAMARNLISLEL
mgnify:CR=1 FL=1